LNAELGEHLGYGKYQESGTENSRNGFSRKTLKTETVNSKWRYRVTATAALNRNWSASTKPALPRWTTKSWACTPRA